MAASEFCKSMSALIKSILRLLIVLDPLNITIIIIIIINNNNNLLISSAHLYMSMIRCAFLSTKYENIID